jgi:hypothetical protein
MFGRLTIMKNIIMNLKDLKSFSEFVYSSYKSALDKVEHHESSEEEACTEHFKIIQNKLLDV